MTCKQVLALIDALPFAESRASQLTGARHHARGCASCQEALAAAEALDLGLGRLPEPAPPVDLAGIIMARTAQHEEQSAKARLEVPQLAPAKTRGNPMAWAALVVGVVISLGAQVYRLFTGEATIQMGSPFPRGGIQAFAAMPSASPAVFVLVAGLLLFAIGLLAPFGGNNRVRTK